MKSGMLVWLQLGSCPRPTPCPRSITCRALPRLGQPLGWAAAGAASAPLPRLDGAACAARGVCVGRRGVKAGAPQPRQAERSVPGLQNQPDISPSPPALLALLLRARPCRQGLSKAPAGTRRAGSAHETSRRKDNAQIPQIDREAGFWGLPMLGGGALPAS